MSFVTTPISSSSPSARQSAATSELLPEPTGPPIPIRSARSGGKEPPLAGGVGERAQLERGREAAGQPVARGAAAAASRSISGSGLDEPAGGGGPVDREQPDGGGRDRRQRPRRGRRGPSRGRRARRPRRRRRTRPAAASSALAARYAASRARVRPDGRRGAQQLRAEPVAAARSGGLGQRAAASRSSASSRVERLGAAPQPRRRDAASGPATPWSRPARKRGDSVDARARPRPPPRGRPSARTRPAGKRESVSRRSGSEAISEEEVALGQRQLGRGAAARSARRRSRPRKRVAARRGSPAARCSRACRPCRAGGCRRPATSRRRSPSRSASPASSAAGATNASEASAAPRPAPANIGRPNTGCGVGIEAFASPICAQAIAPPLSDDVRPDAEERADPRARGRRACPASTEPTSRVDPVRDRRADRVLGDVAAGAQRCRPAAAPAGRAAPSSRGRSARCG